MRRGAIATSSGSFSWVCEVAKVKGKTAVLIFIADRDGEGNITNQRYIAKLKPKSARRFAQWILDNTEA